MNKSEIICIALSIIIVAFNAGYAVACHDIRKWIREEMKNDEEI